MPIRPENKHRYPNDWKLRSRFVRFYRAKNKCEWCGIPNGAIRDKDDPTIWFTLDDGHAADSWFLGRENKASRVVLTCAHVFDDRPEASSLLNLAALCQRCHNRHDAKDRQERRKARIERESGQMNLFASNDRNELRLLEKNYEIQR